MNQPNTTATEDQIVLDGSALQQELATAAPKERERIIREVVRKQTAAVLDVASTEDDSNFLEQGITSLKALELTRNLMTLTNVEIPLVAVIEHPTPAQLTQYITEALADTAND
jgi:acyl carrier protein